MARAFEYYFDFSCPYAYLASTQVEALAARVSAALLPRPILLGGVFQALGVPQNLAGTLSPQKTRHNADDLRRFAQVLGVPYRVPEPAPGQASGGHPRRTVDALRAVLAVGAPYMPLAHQFFRAYWVDNIDIGTAEGMTAVLTRAGHDAAAVLARANAPEIKEELRTRTAEAVARGVFGVPAFFVGGDLYWGQDRLDYVEEALGGRAAAPEPVGQGAERPGASGPSPVDFFFDYSSPFSYVAAEKADRVLGSAARWRPMLLGAVFKAVGTANVPLFEQSQARQRYVTADFERQARRVGAPVRWPTRFPMNTVLALRVTLLADLAESGPARETGLRRGPKVRSLIRALYRGYWSEDRDISSPAVVAEIAQSCGFDGEALLRGAGEAPAKEALRQETDAAIAFGVFGAPSFVVHLADSAPALYWGADRMELAARAASGDERAI